MLDPARLNSQATGEEKEVEAEFTPAGAARGFARWWWVGAGALAVLIAVITILWQVGWIFTNSDTNRQSHLNRSGYEYQQTLREQITAQIANTATLTTQIAASADPNLIAALKAQRMAVAGIACQDAAETTGDPLPAQQAQWVTANCQAGTVRPGSPLYQAGTP